MRTALALTLLLAGGGGQAQSHDFFDRWCCQGDKDCKPAPLKSVAWTPSGWQVVTSFGTFMIRPDDERIRYVPAKEDQQFYICEYPKRHIRCLYIPEPGG